MQEKYHVILTDELGEEFSIELMAHDMATACDMVMTEYPESSLVTIRQIKPYNRGY